VLTQEITSETRQNLESRLLLKQYMTARVNDDLHVPPTRILLAQAGLLQK
jgi:dynein regulatory complex protein 1